MNVFKAQLVVGCAVLATMVHVSIADAQTTTMATGSMEATITTSTPVSIPTTPSVPPSPKPLPLELQSRVINLAANISNRADALILRFDLIIVRMESRLKKMEAAGYDTTDARFYTEEAKKSLEGARISIGGIDEKILAFTTAENYWVGWFNVRDTYLDLRSQLQKTKQLLGEAVTDMKASVSDGIPSRAATTTTATTSSSI